MAGLIERHVLGRSAFADAARARIRILRAHPWKVAVAALVAGAAVAAALAGPTGRSASIGRWQSAGLIGVRGEPAGTCAVALGPASRRLDGDQWIICGGTTAHRCYRQRAHALDFKTQPIRPTRFDHDCRAALAVLEKAGLLH